MNIDLQTPQDDARADTVISALRKRNGGLSPGDREAKYLKMASAPLAFYRGANHLYWADITGGWADCIGAERLLQFGEQRFGDESVGEGDRCLFPCLPRYPDLV